MIHEMNIRKHLLNITREFKVRTWTKSLNSWIPLNMQMQFQDFQIGKWLSVGDDDGF